MTSEVEFCSSVIKSTPTLATADSSLESATIKPGEKQHLQYTTTSPLMQRRLGVAAPAPVAQAEPARRSVAG